MPYSMSGSVMPYTRIQKERWPGGYGAKVVPLVYPGQEVLPDQPIMRVERDRIVDSIHVVPRLSLPSVNANLEPQTDAGQVGVENTNRVQTVPAGMHGRVVSITPRGGIVIETQAAIVYGAIGAGNQVAGKLTMWYAANTGYGVQTIPPGAILVIPGPLNFSMLRQAQHSGVSGIIASSIAPHDLEGFLAADLVELLNDQNIEQVQARLPALTLLLTEGLGSLAMSARIMNLLSQYQGSFALLSGITSTRQGIFPELLISLPDKDIRPLRPAYQAQVALVPGLQVQVRGGQYNGAIGVIDYLFAHQQLFASGIRTRAARLLLEDGSYIIIPLALLEYSG